MNGICAICGRVAANIDDLLEVNGHRVELCGPCMGIPVAVLFLSLAHLSRASYPPPSLPQPAVSENVG